MVRTAGRTEVKECPSGQVAHWCDYECVPEEFAAADDARLRELMAEAQGMAPSVPSGPVAAGDETVVVPQIFGGGVGSTLFDGQVDLPEAAFKHPVNVKVEYPDGSVLGVNHPTAEQQRSIDYMEQQRAMDQGVAPARPGSGGGEMPGGVGGDTRKSLPGADLNPHLMEGLQQAMGGGLGGAVESGGGGGSKEVVPLPTEAEREAAGVDPGLEARQRWAREHPGQDPWAHVVLNNELVNVPRPVVPAVSKKSSGLRSITGFASMGSVTGMAGTVPAGSMQPTNAGPAGGASTGSPAGFKAVDKKGTENPANQKPVCSVSNPPLIPKPAGSPVPVITRGGTGTTVIISTAPPEGIPPEGTAIGSIATATQSAVTLNFPTPANIALQQRAIGTGLWGSVFGGQYANTWLNAPNIELPTGGAGGATSGGASGGASSPPPEEETPAPVIPAPEPEPGETAGTGGAGAMPEGTGGGEREGLAPKAGEAGSGQGAIPGTGEVVADVKSDKSFWSWLRGLFS